MIDLGRLREQSVEELEKLARRKLSPEEAKAVSEELARRYRTHYSGAVSDLTKKVETEHRAKQIQQQPAPAAEGCQAVIIFIIACVVVVGAITTF